MYYKERYYDPTLGAFISPDTIIPDPGMGIDYNRFLYARGNPLKYSDPSGNASCSTDKCWERRCYWAHGYYKQGDHYTGRMQAIFMDAAILTDVLGEAGIEIDEDTWNLSDPTEFRRASLLAQGVVAFGQKIAEVGNVGIETGFAHLMTLIGGEVIWYRADKGGWWSPCHLGAACAVEPGRIGFYDGLFSSYDEADLPGIAVRELAHKVHFANCGGHGGGCYQFLWLGSTAFWATRFLPEKYRYQVSEYGMSNPVEYWAEAVADWVYGDEYLGNAAGRGNLAFFQTWFTNWFFRP